MDDRLRLSLRNFLKCQPIYFVENVLALFTHILFEGHFTKARYLKDECMESEFLNGMEG